MNLRTLLMLLLLFVVWISPGLFGREPWKADEPYSFGIVSEMIRTGDFVMPSLTGEVFLEKPPIFFITGTVFGRLFSPPLAPYDAARLAAAFYMLLTLLFTALAARELYGAHEMAAAVILLIGCFHLQVTAHKLITDVSLLTGFSMAFYGFARAARNPGAGGFWIGTGTGLGFLSKGIIAPGLLGVAALLLPALFRQWRRREYAVALGAAFVAVLPWLVIWPFALFRRSPELFTRWFWHQNFGRFAGFNAGAVGFNPQAADSHFFYVGNLVWLGWPVVLPAFWALWRFRRSWREHPAFQVPLVSFAVMIGVLSASATNRALYAVPMLLPLTLMAVPGMRELPLRAGTIAHRASLAFFGLLAFLLWFGWTTMMTGAPATLARRIHEFQPDYDPALNGVLLAVAVVYTLAWLFLVIRVTRSPRHAALNWTLGMVMAWALVMTLWLPALDKGSSYRADFLDLKRSLPASYSCIASLGLGESERAMLDHFTGIRTRRIEAGAAPGDCDLLLEQRPGQSASLITGEWKRIWEYRHPSVKPKDIFSLYVRDAKE